jgi:hypothetical protein
MERTGQCHCGSLRVIATDEPDRVYLCHCKACQRRTGTAFHFGATYPKERVRLDGERKIYERDADSGYRIRFHFCASCGTTLYWEGDRNPAVCGVAVCFPPARAPFGCGRNFADSPLEGNGFELPVPRQNVQRLQGSRSVRSIIGALRKSKPPPLRPVSTCPSPDRRLGLPTHGRGRMHAGLRSNAWDRSGVHGDRR